MDNSSKKKGLTFRSVPIFFLCAIPNFLICLGAFVFIVFYLFTYASGSPVWAPAVSIIALLGFLLSGLTLFLLWYYLGKSDRYLTRLLREYGIISPDKEYTFSTFFSRSGRERVFSTAQAYSDKITQLQFLRSQAEFTAQQSQIDPHFLYNTLDTIRGKAMEHEQNEIADMIESLSRIFRYSISNKSDMFILKDELKNVQDYIKIQQIRFANRFSFEYNVDEEDWRLLYFRVPKLILQPLIENAIIHGLEGMVSGGVVSLSAYRTAYQVILRVVDNGKGIPAPQVKALCASLRNPVLQSNTPVKGGIALTNINKRLKYTFGTEYGLVLSSAENYGTTVEIVMPYAEVQP